MSRFTKGQLVRVSSPLFSTHLLGCSGHITQMHDRDQCDVYMETERCSVRFQESELEAVVDPLAEKYNKTQEFYLLRWEEKHHTLPDVTSQFFRHFGSREEAEAHLTKAPPEVLNPALIRRTITEEVIS